MLGKTSLFLPQDGENETLRSTQPSLLTSKKLVI